uniref:Uncharacterized protein n=1 Tax=Anguilla anguilla TaxID=7936 RepID=A0A0E9RFX0_ANGAN
MHNERKPILYFVFCSFPLCPKMYQTVKSNPVGYIPN